MDIDNIAQALSVFIRLASDVESLVHDSGSLANPDDLSR